MYLSWSILVWTDGWVDGWKTGLFVELKGFIFYMKAFTSLLKYKSSSGIYSGSLMSLSAAQKKRQYAPLSIFSWHQTGVSNQHTPGQGCRSEGPEQLEEWANRNLTKFDKDKFEVLQLEWSDPLQEYRLLVSSAGEDAGVLLSSRLNMSQWCALAAGKAKNLVQPGLYQQEHGHQMEISDYPPLCRTHEIHLERILHPDFSTDW